MPDITVKVMKSIDKDVKLPKYQTVGSAGCDVHANDTVIIQPGERRLVATGMRFEIPEGYECQIRPRSSLARHHGVVVFNSPSTIDSDYRGEIAVLLVNTSTVPFKVTKGDRIAQFVFAPVTRATFELVDSLDETERGTGGWGSTGV